MSYNFNENWYLEDFRPEECDSDKCDLKMAAIMVAILAAIFNMVAKTHNKFRSAQMLQLQRKLIFRVFRGMWSWPMRFQNVGHFGSHF